jgi:hypothetical protein
VFEATEIDQHIAQVHGFKGGGHFGIIRWAVSEARDRIYGFGHAQEVMRQLPPVFCRTKVHIALASFSGLPLAL